MAIRLGRPIGLIVGVKNAVLRVAIRLGRPIGLIVGVKNAVLRVAIRTQAWLRL